MAILPNIPEYGTERFTRSSDGSFVAEASDFGSLAERFQTSRMPMPGGAIYDDACDFGFYLVSQRTGRKVLVVLSGEERSKDEDNELLAWHYRTADQHKDPLVCVTIYND